MTSARTTVVSTTAVGTTVAEFARLVGGAAPASDAPAGYRYDDFATFVEVQDGSVVAVEQFYTS